MKLDKKYGFCKPFSAQERITKNVHSCAQEHVSQLSFFFCSGACLLRDRTTQRIDSVLPREQQLNLEPI